MAALEQVRTIFDKEGKCVKIPATECETLHPVEEGRGEGKANSEISGCTVFHAA
jgi:hypothetical protein